MFEVIYLILALVFSLLLRLWVIRMSVGWFARGFAGDSSVHLQIIEALRKRPKTIKIDNYVIPNRMSYPVLFHKFCLLFSDRIIRSKSYLPNFILYFLFVLSFSLYVNHLGHEYIDGFPVWGAAFAVVLFSVSVQHLTTVGPSIAYTKLSARLMGKLGSSFYIFGLFGYLQFDDSLGIAISIAGAVVAFLSSTFGAQVLLFSAPLISLLVWSLSPLVIVITGLVVAITVSRGYAWTSVSSMYKYWKIYKQYVKKSRYQKGGLSSFLPLREIAESFAEKKPKTFIRLLMKYEPTRSLFYYPELLVIGIFFITGLVDPILASIWPIYASILLIYLITATRTFNYLGEAYRYIEYGLGALNPFVLFYAISIGPSNTSTLILAAGYLLATLIISLTLQMKFGHKPPKTGDTLSRFARKVGITKDDVIFPVTMRLGADLVARTGCKSFWWQPGAITDSAMFEEYIHEYPYLNINWRRLAKKHNVTKIVVDDAALDAFCDKYDFSGLKLIDQESGYTAYEYSE